MAGWAIARGVSLVAARGSRRTAAWMRGSTPLSLPGATIPAFAIESETPVMALIGVFRPTLLIARPILQILTAEELSASVAHEGRSLARWTISSGSRCARRRTCSP